MSVNEGMLDRVIRITLGVVLVAWALFGSQGGWQLVGWIGLVPLVTGIAGFCPLYRLLGWSTCPVSGKS